MATVETTLELPEISDLVRISKAIAMLDAILCKDWAFRYYSFNSRWTNDNPHEMMASMRNGSGNHYFIWFSSIGAAIKGFDHESILSPENNQGKHYPGVLDQVPAEFAEFINEPAFAINETTFCFWRSKADHTWHSGDVQFPDNADIDPDGSEALLEIIDGQPLTYVNFASDYFELEIAEADVAHIYALKPLTKDLLERLHCQRSLNDLAEDIEEIGYPS